MPHPKLFPVLSTRLATAVAGVFLLAGTAIGQPSQDPLLSRDGGGVKPNIMLTMDDSGSMMFQHMPENTIYVGSFTVTSPVGTQSVTMDPSDTFILPGFFIGTIASVPGSTNYRQKLLRSPDTNTIYYNPEIRYRPWAVDTYPLPAATSTNPAGRMANSIITAAPLDPMNPVTGGIVNLTNVRTVTTTWCYRDAITNCSAGTKNYDPGLFYRLNKTAGAYQNPTTAGNYTEFSVNTAGTFTKATARTDCAGTTCTQTEERQNFANWFTYYRSRNLLARGSLMEAFSQSADTFRLGYGRINKGSSSIDGTNTSTIQAGVRDFTQATKTNLFNWLGTLPANGGTPLPDAMDDVGKYYSRTDRRGPWADVPGSNSNVVADNKTCRRAYNIMVTDGYWNSNSTSFLNSDNTDGDTINATGKSYQYIATRPYRDDKSDTLADVAMNYWKNDLQPNMANNVVPSADNPAFWQNMTNFMVGLGVRGTLNPDKLPGGAANPASDLPALTMDALATGAKSWGSDRIDDLWHAALNSRGDFISAKDPSELAAAIQGAVGGVLDRELREAGVATASAVLEAGNRKYVPFYKTSEWTGDIQAFVLDASGQAGALAWTAATKLPAFGSRNIYTWSTDASPSPAAVPFTWATMGASNQAALGTVGSTYTTGLVNFLRGDRSMEGSGQPFRERKSVLGDFINSNPVLIKGSLNMRYGTLPASQGGNGATPSYTQFLATKAARTAVLFVGGNDGMLHAFKDTVGTISADDGKEVFAYVPKAVYPNLSKLSDPTYGTTAMYHQFYVDGPMVEADAYINAPGDSTPSWRNYLVGSLGAGGRAVFALDVTDTANLGASTVRWELSSATNSDLGNVMSAINVGVLPNGEWVAIFGNGSFSSSGKATLFVVNLQTGSAQTLDVETATGSNGLGGVGAVLNTAGQITSLYAGDLKGKMWKFDYSSTASSRFVISGGAPFFTAATAGGVAQPITQAPVVYDLSKAGNSGKLVVFGTGVLQTVADTNSTALQSAYGVWDQTGDTLPRPLTRSSLQARTLAQVNGANDAVFFSLSGAAVNWTTQRGWVIDLDAVSGMRVIYPPQIVTNTLTLISAVVPASNVQICTAGSGSGANLLFDVTAGLATPYPMFDTNGDGVYDSSDALVAGYGTGADGIDAVVRSRGTGGVSGLRGLIGSAGSGSGGTGGPGGDGCSAGYSKTSLQNTTSQLSICTKDDDIATGYPRTIRDRIWRRIINPPIR